MTTSTTELRPQYDSSRGIYFQLSNQVRCYYDHHECSTLLQRLCYDHTTIIPRPTTTFLCIFYDHYDRVTLSLRLYYARYDSTTLTKTPLRSVELKFQNLVRGAGATLVMKYCYMVCFLWHVKQHELR